MTERAYEITPDPGVEADFTWLGQEVARLARIAAKPRRATRAQIVEWLEEGRRLARRIEDMQRWAVKRVIRPASGPVTKAEDRILGIRDEGPPW